MNKKSNLQSLNFHFLKLNERLTEKQKYKINVILVRA